MLQVGLLFRAAHPKSVSYTHLDVYKRQIEYHVNSLKYPEENFYKSLAVAACGPHSFNYTAKLECQKHKWTKDCPNIYFYDESFD